MSTPGDAEADALAVELNDRFRERIGVLAFRQLRNWDAAQDVAQETIRRVLEALRAGRVENLTALPAFVFQTARNICLVQQRSARRQFGALLRFSGGQSEASPEEDDPLRSLIDRERVAKLRNALEGLDGDDRRFLEMCFVEAAETAEIARRLSVEPGAIRVRKHRLLRRLAQLLHGEAGNESGRSETV